VPEAEGKGGKGESHLTKHSGRYFPRRARKKKRLCRPTRGEKKEKDRAALAKEGQSVALIRR